MNTLPTDNHEVIRVFIQPNLSTQSPMLTVTLIACTILLIYFFQFYFPK